MPSTSKKQSNFMKAVANNPKFAKRVGVSQKVGKDFSMADKKKGKYAAGGVGEVAGRMLRGKRPPPSDTDDRMKPFNPKDYGLPVRGDPRDRMKPFNPKDYGLPVRGDPRDRMQPPSPKDFKGISERATRPDPYERMPKKSEGWNKGMLRTDTGIDGKKKGGKVNAKKYAAGGTAVSKFPTAKEMGSMNMAKGGSAKAGRALVKKSADTMGRAMKFAKGGSIDGIAKKGKTKARMPKMNKGGYC